MDSMLEHVEPMEVAEQLCILNSEIFRNIHPIEFLKEIWKKAEEDPSPSFNFFVERFNKESYWAATEIISLQDPRQRGHSSKPAAPWRSRLLMPLSSSSSSSL